MAVTAFHEGHGYSLALGVILSPVLEVSLSSPDVQIARKRDAFQPVNSPLKHGYSEVLEFGGTHFGYNIEPLSSDIAGNTTFLIVF